MGECKMPVKLRDKRPDPVLRRITDALRDYAAAHPHAEIEAYRYNPVSVRIRIVNPEFRGQSRTQREDEVWAALERLPEETLEEISLLLLFTPQEAKKSLANAEFDHPAPSPL